MTRESLSVAHNKMIDLSFMAAKYGIERTDVMDFYNDMCRKKVLQATPQMAPNWFCRKYFNGHADNFVEYFNQNPNVFLNPHWQNINFTGEEYLTLLKNPPIKKNIAIVGLFGSGRTALQQICAKTRAINAIFQTSLESIGYNADHPIIASGHACIRHVAEFQMAPGETTKNLLNPAESGEHRIVFTTRNIFDSVLSNWAWWVHFTRIGKPHLLGRKQVFGSDERFVNHIEENIEAFYEFCKSGIISCKPSFKHKTQKIIKFLSISEYQEESELWISNKNVQPLHFEDLILKNSVPKIVEQFLGPSADKLLKETNFVGHPFGHIKIFSMSPLIRDIFSSILGAANFRKSRISIEKQFF